MYRAAKVAETSTTFTGFLRINDKTLIDPMSIERPEKIISEPIKILHIDDDSGFLDLTKAFLEKEFNEIDITTAIGSTEGLERIEDGAFHCVISDYEMPRMDGLELLAEVRKEHPELPFVLYTGKGSEEIAGKAINAGVTGYFQKGGPEQHRRLANRVKHAAKEYQTQIESERYSTVLRALDYPVYVVNDEAEFEYVSEAFLTLTGYDREEIIGSQPEKIKTDEAAQRANDILAEIVSSDGPESKKFRVDIRRKDGETVPCYDHMAALPFDEDFRGSVGILRDATRETRQRKELIRQNKRLEEFTSIVSHDLRTPLGNAQTAATLARSTADESHFDTLESELDRMDRMIDELLTLAKEGEAVSETEPIDLGRLATEAWEPFGSTQDSLYIPEGTARIDADKSRFRRLLENLFRNAVEHCPSPVTVTVGRTESGFYVADDGPGIDEANHEDVFEPGYTTVEDGTGFGLAIVRRIADAHGWEVAVTRSDSGGTRFDVQVTSNPEVSESHPVVS
jgi:PAS domain S-box-containing protein